MKRKRRMRKMIINNQNFIIFKADAVYRTQKENYEHQNNNNGEKASIATG
jgi:hypothetical protein